MSDRVCSSEPASAWNRDPGPGRPRPPGPQAVSIERLQLVRPSSIYKDSYLDARHEGFGVGRRTHWTEAQIEEIAGSFAAHLASLDSDGQSQHADGAKFHPGVPSNMFWLVADEVFVGGLSIRARIDTAVLVAFGGHIGYGIRPSLEGRGYGKRQLALGLSVCRGMGMGTVRISCREWNIGSRRIIETNGGILLRRCEPNAHCDEPHLLFEIPLIGEREI